MSTGTAPPGSASRGRSLSFRRKPPLPLQSSPESVPTRRRWGRVAAGAALALLGGWISVSLYVSAGDRVEVVALARDVEQYSELSEDDFTTVLVSVEPEVDTISADEIDELVGRHNVVRLVEGSLLAPNQLLAEDEPLIFDDETVISTQLNRNQAPFSILEQGTDVMVQWPSAEEGAPPRQVPGWVLHVGEEEENSTQGRTVEVVVEDAAEEVQLAAQEGTVALSVPGGF